VYLFCKNILGVIELGIISAIITSIDPFLVYFVREVMQETLTAF